MRKRIFAALLTLVMALSLLPVNVSAAQNEMSWTWTVTIIGGNFYRSDGMASSTNKYTTNRHLDNTKDNDIGYKFEWNASAGGRVYNGGWQLCITVNGQIVERTTAYIYTKDMSTAADSWTAPGSSHTGNSSHPFTLYLNRYPGMTPNLSIKKNTTAKEVKVGDQFTYTITVSNASGAAQATNVTVEDTLPDGLEFVSSTPRPTFQNGQKLTWTFSSIAAGSSETIRLTVKATKAGTYTNTAKINGTDKSDTAGGVTVVEPEKPVTENEVTITKNIAGLDGVTLDKAATFDFTITKQVFENNEWVNAAGDPTTVSVTVPANALSASSNALTLSVTGEKERYVVAETTPAADITAGGKTYEWKNVSISNDGQFTLGTDAVSVTATNTYAEKELTPETGSIKVVKEISGLSVELKDYSNKFEFVLKDGDGNQIGEPKKAVYNATNDQLEVVFDGLDVSKQYKVSETASSAQVKGYEVKTSFSMTTIMSLEEPNLDDAVSELFGISANSVKIVTCTNSYEETKEDTYTVTYHGNGNTSGAAPTDNTVYTAGKTATILGRNTLVKSGYTFLGWSLNPNATFASYTAGKTMTVNEDVHLYAVWEKDTTPETPDRDNDGTLVIRKTDANDGSKLTGAYFTVYKQSGSKWVEECTIRTTNGYASTGLDNGKYYVVESMAPAGYTLDETEHSFTISNNTVTLELTNDKTATPAALNDSDHFAYIIGYEDGTVQPSGNITRAEVATIFFRLLTDEVRDEYMSTSNPFSDVKSTAWYNRAVSTLYQLDILKGSNDGNFHPQDTITRAEFAAIAARFSDKKVSGSTPFTDLAGHWAKDEVTAAASLGWVNGYTDGTFRPNQPITRAEAMTLVNRVLNRSPKSVDDLLDNMVKWPDNMDTAKWYYLAVQEATNSHDYKASGSSESWTKLTKAPDWAALEH